MSDSLPDDAWVQSFQTSAPRQLLTALQRRLQQSTAHVNSLAEVYKRRAALEQEYADNLQKLARDAEKGGLLLKGGVGNDWDKNSGEGKIWDNVLSELAEVRLIRLYHSKRELSVDRRLPRTRLSPRYFVRTSSNRFVRCHRRLSHGAASASKMLPSIKR
jgi:hypothetical protein